MESHSSRWNVKIHICTASTYCVRHNRLLKHPLQAIKWDVKPLNPLSSLQVFSEHRIAWYLYLKPRGTTGNVARGRHRCARHLLSISWLNFHCCRETVSHPFSLQAGAWRGSLLSEVNQEGWGSEGEKIGAWGTEMKMLPGFLSASEALRFCASMLKSKRKEEEKRKFTGEVFPSLLCLVITHTHPAAWVNSHVGSE